MANINSNELSKIIGDIESSMFAFARGLAPAINKMRNALDEFGEQYILATKKIYRQHFGSLPGGQGRTKRLRKKQRDVVIRWMSRELENK